MEEESKLIIEKLSRIPVNDCGGTVTLEDINRLKQLLLEANV